MSSTARTTITKEVNGNTYTAVRVIEGTRKIRQHLVFRGHIEHDSHTYSPGEMGMMDAAIDVIFWQLIARGWPGQAPLEPPEDHVEHS